MDNPIIRRIDKGSRIPYYYQLGEILKEEIELGRWAPGELVPSEAGIAELFGVSRTVIRKALDMLEADGAVIRIKGKGTVVAEPKFRYEAVTAAGEWSRGAVAGESRLGRVVDIRTVPGWRPRRAGTPHGAERGGLRAHRRPVRRRRARVLQPDLPAQGRNAGTQRGCRGSRS